MIAARSTFAGAAPFKSLTVRIERHPKDEVFTLDRIETDGRTTTSRTIVYFDGHKAVKRPKYARGNQWHGGPFEKEPAPERELVGFVLSRIASDLPRTKKVPTFVSRLDPGFRIPG